ncbi:MAG: restriction endonuclease, partial [Thiotrichaceae bacterium]|nr:restriction endonuclease [Thiotrichaceae bacterium]
LLLQVVCFKPETEAHLQAVWDDFLMSKLLPRIDGDEDKLRIKQGDDVTNLLDVLTGILEDQLSEIWDGTRLDYYREMQDGSEVDNITCRTKAKLLWMKNRLEVNTFTSFWP